ncbi:hypothetical protein MSG28_003553 [Choristoneura fumiferana]|uniref:Uncharacterized protein n=1 Tax=Choristoneura fumiferana TaxID=7141 RepID=A0ACC0KGK0_CHOFU|nr:hypothetical protein MSG28_003553 [Choristoneura fumiferana]
MGDDHKSKMDLSRSKGDLGNRSTLGVKSGMLKSQAQLAGRSMSRMKLGIEFKRPPLMYFNTYQLDPRRFFHIANVTKLVEEMLDESFEGHKYNIMDSPALAIRLAGEIMRKLKTMDFERYRFISVVTIGQRRSQCYNNAITFLWDHERDAYVNVQRDVPTAFIQVTVFGIYLD